MPDIPSRFVEILDADEGYPRISDSDVKLEDVLADHEATVSRARSSTQSSSSSTSSSSKDRSGRDDHTASTSRMKRLRKFTLTGR
jgi:hypothetical protein